MAIEVSKWDASEYLETEEDMAAYLNAVIAENDSALLKTSNAPVKLGFFYPKRSRVSVKPLTHIWMRAASPQCRDWRRR